MEKIEIMKRDLYIYQYLIYNLGGTPEKENIIVNILTNHR